MFLILASTVCNILETEPAIHAADPLFFSVFEAICVIVFTVEFMFRLASCPERKYGRFMRHPMNLVDLLAFGPWYVEKIAESAASAADPDLQQAITDMVQILRVPRALRLLRVARYSPVLKVGHADGGHADGVVGHANRVRADGVTGHSSTSMHSHTQPSRQSTNVSWYWLLHTDIRAAVWHFFSRT